eukprot:m.118575 g.118575  ORF g.118575 m.118575 type:complete len:553 (-) comp28674_c0_seq4:188-1846(-)
MPKSKKKTRREHTPTTPAPTSAVIGAHFPPSEDLVDSTYVAPPIRFLPISDPGDQASIYAFIQDCVQDPFFNPLLPRFEIDQPLPKRPTLGSLCERVEPYLNRLFPAEPRTDRELFHAYIAPTAASLVKKVRAVRVFDLYLLALQVGIDVFAHSSPTSTSPTMEPDVQPDPTTPAPTTIPAPVPPTDASNHPQQPSHNLQLEAQLLQANDKLVALRARVTAAHLREAQVETERLTAQLSDAASMSDLNSRLKGTADQPVVAPTNQQKRQQTADDKDVEREALLAKIDELSRRLEAAETRTPQMQNAVDVYGKSQPTFTSTPKILVGQAGLKASDQAATSCPPQIILKLRNHQPLTIRVILAYILNQTVEDLHDFVVDAEGATVRRSRAVTKYRVRSERELVWVVTSLVAGFTEIDFEAGNYLFRTWALGFFQMQRIYPDHIALQEEYLQRQLDHFRTCIRKGVMFEASYDHQLAQTLTPIFGNTPKTPLTKPQQQPQPKPSSTPAKPASPTPKTFTGDRAVVANVDCRNWAMSRPCAFIECPFKHDPARKPK